jgi:energy-converting hydrogenase Eha subunit H
VHDFHMAWTMIGFMSLVTGVWLVHVWISRRAFQKLSMIATLILFGAAGLSFFSY